jgi:hypothetical protein
VLDASFGRLLYHPRYLWWALGAYCGLGFVTYLWLAIHFGTLKGKALAIAYDVATGASPLNYQVDLHPAFPWLWVWMCVFHVLSWLAIPVLIATIVDALCRTYERTRVQAERQLINRLTELGRNKGLSGTALDSFRDDMLAMIDHLTKR